jgi:hypothetical protein
VALKGIVGAMPPAQRAEGAQDALDVLAVAAGLKPLALLGVGDADGSVVSTLSDAARKAGLNVIDAAPWRVMEGWRGLPSWYRNLAELQEGASPVWVVSRPDAAPVPAGGSEISVGEEAAALGYPECCVRDFHRKRRLFHLFSLRAISRQTAGDTEAMRRLAGAQIMLAPRSAAERRALALATRMDFAPATSVAMCRVCENAADSAAMRLSACHRALAVDAGAETFLMSPGQRACPVD